MKLNPFLSGLDFTERGLGVTGSSKETQKLLRGESTATVLCITGAGRYTVKHERGRDRATESAQSPHGATSTISGHATNLLSFMIAISPGWTIAPVITVTHRI